MKILTHVGTSRLLYIFTHPWKHFDIHIALTLAVIMQVQIILTG